MSTRGGVALSLTILLVGVLIATGVRDSALGAPVRQVLRMNLETGEPATLDPAKIDNRAAGTVAKQLFEGLTRLDQNGNVIPGVAERWTVSGDGKVYTFFLRRKRGGPTATRSLRRISSTRTSARSGRSSARHWLITSSSSSMLKDLMAARSVIRRRWASGLSTTLQLRSASTPQPPSS